MRRRARRLAEHEQDPGLADLLAVRPAGLTSAIRTAGLAHLDVEQVLHALRFTADGVPHAPATKALDPVAVLVWRLRPWGVLVARYGIEAAFADHARRVDRLDAIRRRRAAEAAEVTSAAPMPESVRTQLADLRSARRRREQEALQDCVAMQRTLLDRFPVTDLREAR